VSVNFNYYPQEPKDFKTGRCVLPCLDCRELELEILRLKLELAEQKIALKSLQKSARIEEQENKQ